MKCPCNFSTANAALYVGKGEVIDQSLLIYLDSVVIYSTYFNTYPQWAHLVDMKLKLWLDAVMPWYSSWNTVITTTVQCKPATYANSVGQGK